MELQAEKWDDPDTVALSEGENIALRRNRLGWKQGLLAERAGVSLATVLKIEKDRNVRVDMLRAVESALDQAEREAGPDLSPLPDTTDTVKDGADVSGQTREIKLSLGRMEIFLSGALEEIRRTMADLDKQDQAAKSARKRA